MACIAQSTLRVHGNSKPIVARFDQPHASSDGGAVLLKLVDDRLGLTWRLAGAIRGRRQPAKVAHPLRDLLRQRVFGLACGYADCNDAARLPTTRSTSCCSTAIRSTAGPWDRSPRCRGSRTPWAGPISIGSGRRWPTPC
jgi:Transposase DDE domain group 1